MLKYIIAAVLIIGGLGWCYLCLMAESMRPSGGQMGEFFSYGWPGMLAILIGIACAVWG